MISNLQLALWIAHPVLQSAVAIAMFRRKLYKAFPFFFTYTISQVVTFCILFPLFRLDYGTAFYYAYWACAAISLAIGFKVIHEVFLDVFRPYHTLKDLGSVLFKWAALVMMLVAFVVAAGSAANEMGAFGEAVITVQRCVRVVQCGLILFLLVFSRYLGVSWKQQSFGIALGFGGFASVELAMATLNVSGRLNHTTKDLGIMVSYNLAIMVWLAYTFVKSPARASSATLLTSQRWERSLSDLRTPANADSLIPMFEGMVDRAFSRTNSELAQEKVEPEPVPLPRKVASSRGAVFSISHAPSKS
jgi:hypothetical protein